MLRPCIVAGPQAPALADAMPWNQLPGPVRKVSQALPLLKPPFPDPGTPLQLVHHDDVAAAIAVATTTSAAPGAYNIAGDGVLSMSDVAEALGARPVRVPRLAMSAASEVVARLPFVPSALEWLHVGRTSVVMDTSKAKTQLGWTPKYTAAETLALTEPSQPSLAIAERWSAGSGASLIGPVAAILVHPWPDRFGRRLWLPPTPRPTRRSRAFPWSPTGTTRSMGLSFSCCDVVVDPPSLAAPCRAVPGRSHPSDGNPAPRVRARRSTGCSGSSRTSPRRVRRTG